MNNIMNDIIVNDINNFLSGLELSYYHNVICKYNIPTSDTNVYVIFDIRESFII